VLVSEIATRIKDQFGDDQGGVITDARVMRWVNDAMRDIAVANNLFLVKATAAVVNGQAEYQVPSNILTLHSVKFQGRKLTGLSQTEADEFQADGSAVPTGIPTHFWLFGNVLTLYPTPNLNDPNDLLVQYTRTPTEVTAVGNTPELPAQYHNRIVEYCIAQAAELDDDGDTYERKMNRFEVGVQKLKDNAEWEAHDVYPSITVGPADLGYYDDSVTW